MEQYVKRVKYLAEALPYIQAFRDKIFVIKFGGSIQQSDPATNAFVQDIALLHLLGMRVVIVHGGGKEISRRLDKVGIQSTFKKGYRVTCDQAIEEVEMVLSGRINKDLTWRLNDAGAKAVGLNGKDAGLLEAVYKKIETKEGMESIGHVGDVVRVHGGIIHTLLDNQVIPVVSPIGYDRAGSTLNINADAVAASIAVDLQAEKLILLTDVDGLYETYGKPETLIRTIRAHELECQLQNEVYQGGMIPKLTCAIHAISGGTGSVHVLNGTWEHAILLEVFTDDGVGTMITE